MIDERMQAALARLTDNERICLRRRLGHQTAKEMALDLGISPHAVEKRLKMARTKLGVSSSLEAAQLLSASERYGGMGPQASALAPAAETRQAHESRPEPNPAQWRTRSFAFAGVVVMSLAVLALFALSPPSAPDGADAQQAIADATQSRQSVYLVQLLLRQGDKPIGSPKLLVDAGKTARVTAANADGARYDISVSVEEREESAYLVTLDVEGKTPGGRSVHVTPTALIEAGAPANLTAGPAGEPLNMTLVVTQAARSAPGITTLKELRRSKGMDDPPPRMAKVSPELVRQFLNETFDSADKDHSGFIERAEAPEQAIPVDPVELKGPPDYSKGPPPQDENEHLILLKGPVGQAAYIALWDEDADGRASRQEYIDANFEKFLAWGVPANWRGAQEATRTQASVSKD